MTLLTKEAVDAYNQNNPDEDELIFEEVEQELKDIIEYTVESIQESISEAREKVVDRWFNYNCRYSDYLQNIPSELMYEIDTLEFAKEVVRKVNGR